MAAAGDNADLEQQVSTSTAALRLFQREPHFTTSLTLKQGASGPVKASHDVLFNPLKYTLIIAENDLKTC